MCNALYAALQDVMCPQSWLTRSNSHSGRWLVGASTINIVFLSTVSCIDICVLIGVYYISQHKKDNNTKDTGADEDDIPFLQYDECEGCGDSRSPELNGEYYDKALSP